MGHPGGTNMLKVLPRGLSPADDRGATASPSTTSAPRPMRGHVLDTPCLPSRTLGGLLGCEVLQVREPPVHGLVQGTRRAEQDRPADARGARARRARGVGRQPRAGRGPPRAAPWNPGDDRDAAASRRRSSCRTHARGFNAGRSLEGDSFDDARSGSALAEQRRPDAGASGTTTWPSPRPGHDRARDARPAAFTGHAGRRHRRGGGLISGVATAARAIAPGMRIVGVQTDRFPAVWNAVHGGQQPGG